MSNIFLKWLRHFGDYILPVFHYVITYFDEKLIIILHTPQHSSYISSIYSGWPLFFYPFVRRFCCKSTERLSILGDLRKSFWRSTKEKLQIFLKIKVSTNSWFFIIACAFIPTKEYSVLRVFVRNSLKNKF